VTDLHATSAPAGADPGPAAIRPWTRWAAVVLYMAVLFALSSFSTLPALPGHPSDKLEHAAAFAILGLLVAWAISNGRLRQVSFRTVAIVTLICSAYGYSDEFHQRFVPGRSYDLLDMAADAAGGFIASAALWAWGILSRGSR
jgi:VanZ family protein